MSAQVPNAETLPKMDGFKWIYYGGRERKYVLVTDLSPPQTVLVIKVKRHDHFEICDPIWPHKFVGSLYSLEMLRREVYRASVVHRLIK